MFGFQQVFEIFSAKMDCAFYYRKAGSVHCTAQGLEPDKVKTLTKHKMEIFQKSYMCELSIPVLIVLAGFNPNDVHDNYFVPRTRIGLPGDLTPDELARILFPSIDAWRAEVASDEGDKSKGAEELLSNVLPFLAKVLAQDGIFWIKRFPNNPSVQEFLRLIDGRTGAEHYTFWAARMRQEVKDMVEKKKAAKQRIDGLDEAVSRSMAKLDELEQKLEVANNALERTSQVMHQLGTPLMPPAPRLPATQLAVASAQSEMPSRPVPRRTMPSMGNVLRLGNNPRKPIVNAVSFYKTVERLVFYHETHHHDAIKKRMKADDWQHPKEDPMQWIMLKKIYGRIDERMVELGLTQTKENRAHQARWLDENERKEMTLYQYVNFLRRREGAAGTRPRRR